MDDITTRPLSLDSLLDGITNGTAVLPDFQRDFDWEPGDIVSLIATVLSSWPAGSLLLMRGRPDFFEIREFEFAPPRASRVETVVLDGQQRLTALLVAFRGVGRLKYALDLNELDRSGNVPYSIDAIEAALFGRTAAEWESDYPPSRQAREGIVPMQALASASDFFEWRDEMLELTPDAERKSAGLRLTRIYKDLLGRANKYTFPSVILESDLPAQAVARIFERVNRTGHRLGTFDLLVARTYSRGWNLRDRWDVARRESEYLEHFLGEDGTPILQALALRLLGDVRQPVLLSLTQEQVQNSWDRAVDAFDRTLGIVRNWGVDNPGWLPSKAMLLPLAALAYDNHLDSSDEHLRAWFWARSFSQSYDVGSSTVAAADYKELARFFRDHSDVSASTLDVPALLTATRKQNGSLWRAFVSYLAGNGARDVLDGTLLQNDLSAVAVSFVGRDTAHYGDAHNRILTQIVATKITAKIARAGGLFQESLAPDAVRTQLLPAGGPEERPSLDSFLEERVAQLASSLQETCGRLLSLRVETGDSNAVLIGSDRTEQREE